MSAIDVDDICGMVECGMIEAGIAEGPISL